MSLLFRSLRPCWGVRLSQLLCSSVTGGTFRSAFLRWASRRNRRCQSITNSSSLAGDPSFFRLCKGWTSPPGPKMHGHPAGAALLLLPGRWGSWGFLGMPGMPLMPRSHHLGIHQGSGSHWWVVTIGEDEDIMGMVTMIVHYSYFMWIWYIRTCIHICIYIYIDIHVCIHICTCT